MVFVLLLGACASDSADVAAPPSSSVESKDESVPSSTTASPPTTAQATTTTTTTTTTTEAPATTETPQPPPPQLVECPRPVDPVATADMDGDGVDELLTIEAVEGGQRFVACGADGGRSLDLAFGAWYVAVFDIEPDGTDEVFLGPTEIDDSPSAPRTSLSWLDPTGQNLEPQGGIWLTETSGAGCVDVDDDGDRELIITRIDTEASTSSEVAWTTVAADSPFSGSPREPVTGTFTVGVDDYSIGLLSKVSCGNDLIELIRVPPPASICADSDDQVRVDLDGDGRDDTVSRRYLNDRNFSFFISGPAVAVCTASGLVDQAHLRGMLGISGITVNSGDRPTIWGGGTTATSAIFEPYVFVDGRIVPITDDAGPLHLVEGWPTPDRRRFFGCADLNGNGIVELVQLDGDRDGDEMVWTRRSWETVADRAELVVDEQGRLPWAQPPEGEYSLDLPHQFEHMSAQLSFGQDACQWVGR